MNIQHDYDKLTETPAEKSPVQECSHELEKAYIAYDAALKTQAAADMNMNEAQFSLSLRETELIPKMPDHLRNDLLRKAWLFDACSTEESVLRSSRSQQIAARYETQVALNKVEYWRANLRLLEVQAGLIQARQR